MDEQQALENLIVNNHDFERLEDMLAEFNIFSVLGIDRSENRHSAFLAWLLDPSENHGLSDYFLRGFLSRITSYARALGIGDVTPFTVDQWKLRDTNVETERHRIDILLTNRIDKFVCVIENKVSSAEHGNQLERYRQRVASEYPDLVPLYVFLTIDGEEPVKASDAMNYIPMSYSDIAELIQRALDSRSSSMGINVCGVLHQYVTSLRRYVLVDSDIQRLARQIYYTHKAAIDLIIEAKPDEQQERRDIIESVMKEFPELQPDTSAKSFVRYYPPQWDKIPELLEGDGWTSTGRMLLLEFRNRSTLTLHLVLGPGPKAIRERIFDLGQREKRLFNNVPKTLPPKWSSLYRKSVLTSSVSNEIEAIEEGIRQAVSRFMQDDCGALVDAIVEEWQS